jgi:hypothetical protein
MAEQPKRVYAAPVQPRGRRLTPEEKRRIAEDFVDNLNKTKPSK